MAVDNIFFNPWVGPHYSSGGIFGKHIMVLGDSHYCGTPCGKCGMNSNPKCNRLTSDIIGWCLDSKCEREGRMNTYLKFERSLVGHETTPDESRKIWDPIIFYNFLQVLFTGRVRPVLRNSIRHRSDHLSVGYSWDFLHR